MQEDATIQTPHVTPPAKDSVISKIGDVVFSIRWGLAPMYVGLWVAMFFYIIKFFREVYELGEQFWTMTSNDMLLAVLSLIDITMIGNLIVMTTVGGFSVFVKEYNTKSISDKPRWLNNINSSTIKIKMGMSLIGVTAIHLLSTFMSIDKVSWDQLGKESAIFFLFIFFTYALCVIDEKLHANHNGEHHHA